MIIESNQFFNICKENNSIGDNIRIECSSKNIIFSTNEECKFVNIYKNNNELVKIINNEIDMELNTDNSNDDNLDKNIIIGAYEIKNILIFNKFINYIDKFNLLLRNDKTLIIESSLINNIGSFVIQFNSIMDQEIKNNDISMLNSDTDNMDNKIMFFKLKKINFLKIITDILDKIVSEVNLIFTSNSKKNNFSGLEISCTDLSKTLFLKTKLNNKLFK